MKFKVRYALGGGFGGCKMADPEILEFENEDKAYQYAYEQACEIYDSYDGLHGLRSVEQIMEEDEIEDYDEACEQWEQERESWLDYDVQEIKEGEEEK